LHFIYKFSDGIIGHNLNSKRFYIINNGSSTHIPYYRNVVLENNFQFRREKIRELQIMVHGESVSRELYKY